VIFAIHDEVEMPSERGCWQRLVPQPSILPDESQKP
jgi:hypothetical protein